jgi:hypothetical protein
MMNWWNLDLDSKVVLKDKMKMLVLFKRVIANKVLDCLQYAVNNNIEVIIEVLVYIAATIG